VDGMTGRERRPRAMRNARSRAGALPAGAAAGSSPRAELELALKQSTSIAAHDGAIPLHPGLVSHAPSAEKVGKT
jgi:hypothetical protein